MPVILVIEILGVHSSGGSDDDGGGPKDDFGDDSSSLVFTVNHVTAFRAKYFPFLTSCNPLLNSLLSSSLLNGQILVDPGL